ncbi:hypothetical protein [Roseitranquillus sediminis]|uniref:hypothetical protein n=1 Tax=Roseitranquillus sediminis TaxID=2809051 RepID=UPI001D0C55D3|nr:hypothetical protein [Roseitranquillus sediminis]MBM9595314.1 hypothetical protein [Roseitranquillus sediminis]
MDWTPQTDGYCEQIGPDSWATAAGLAAGAILLALSLLLRSADLRLCQQLPLGTHFAWHLINALMLGYDDRSLSAARA